VNITMAPSVFVVIVAPGRAARLGGPIPIHIRYTARARGDTSCELRRQAHGDSGDPQTRLAKPSLCVYLALLPLTGNSCLTRGEALEIPLTRKGDKQLSARLALADINNLTSPRPQGSKASWP